MKTAMSREAARLLCRPAFVGRTPVASRTEACTLNAVQRGQWDQRRTFVATKILKVVKPYILADIGEGKCRMLKRLNEG
jgi:2-oxoisovalerate dehydrogenase E2 component (dihydrolipoyl transacylase)